jgi:hypothetical protein
MLKELDGSQHCCQGISYHLYRIQDAWWPECPQLALVWSSRSTWHQCVWFLDKGQDSLPSRSQELCPCKDKSDSFEWNQVHPGTDRGTWFHKMPYRQPWTQSQLWIVQWAASAWLSLSLHEWKGSISKSIFVQSHHLQRQSPHTPIVLVYKPPHLVRIISESYPIV